MIGTRLNKKIPKNAYRKKLTNVSKLIFVNEVRMSIVTSRIPQEFWKSANNYIFHIAVRTKRVQSSFRVFVRVNAFGNFSIRRQVPRIVALMTMRDKYFSVEFRFETLIQYFSDIVL